jgi:hypothetical protein
MEYQQVAFQVHVHLPASGSDLRRAQAVDLLCEMISRIEGIVGEGRYDVIGPVVESVRSLSAGISNNSNKIFDSDVNSVLALSG